MPRTITGTRVTREMAWYPNRLAASPKIEGLTIEAALVAANKPALARGTSCGEVVRATLEIESG